MMSEPRLIYCSKCGSPNHVKPADFWNAECAKCLCYIVPQKAVMSAPEPDKKTVAKGVFLAVCVLYFIFQFVLKLPLHYEILHRDYMDEQSGLYLVESRWWIFGTRISHRLHEDKSGKVYYHEGKERHTILPEEVRFPSESYGRPND